MCRITHGPTSRRQRKWDHLPVLGNRPFGLRSPIVRSFLNAFSVLLLILGCRADQLNVHPPDELDIALWQAEALFQSGAYDRAEPIDRWLVSKFKRKEGEDSLVVALLIQNLAEVVRRTRRVRAHKEAQDLQEEALRIAVRHNSRQARLVEAIVLHHQAQFLLDLEFRMLRREGNDFVRGTGKLNIAEQKERRALGLMEAHRELDELLVGNSLEVLSTIVALRHEWAEAEILKRRALAICQRRLGSRHPRTKRVTDELASLVQRKAPGHL